MNKWFKIFIFFFLIIVIGLGVAYQATQKAKPPVKQIFINATVLTMNSTNAIVQAIAVDNDTIVAVGSNQEIKLLIDEDTLIHDLEGKTLLPGFVDAHSHFPGLATGKLTVDLNSPPIGDIDSIKHIITRLQANISTIKEGKWLIGVGYDDSLLKENRHVNRDDLDRVSSTVPILLLHVSGHVVAVNSLGLELTGLEISGQDQKIVAPKGGRFVRDDAGRLTGVIEETARFDALELAFDLSLFDFIDMVEQGAQEYAAVGVTTAQSGLSKEGQIKGFNIIDKLGLIPQRLVIWPDIDTGKRWLSGEFSDESYNSDNVTIGAVKLVADGSIQAYTGFLSSPYHKHATGYGEHSEPDYKGYPSIEQQQLEQVIVELHQKGLQVAVHANGDAAIEMVINAVKKAQTLTPRPDARHIIIHSQMATTNQLERMKVWGITPSFFSSHTYYWGDRHRDIFMGPERSQRISPAKSATDIGLRFSIHLDTPVVPMNPLFGVWSAVNRITSSGQQLGLNERVSVMQALRSVTIDAAWQMFLDKKTGSLEVGKKADLVILAKNPLLQPTTLDKIDVLETYVAGLNIYTAPSR
ncbi:MAG: putative amidohydrolase YtcJ [Parvicella sp.]|jgi:predicted amidohydrolase YtcJ